MLSKGNENTTWTYLRFVLKSATYHLSPVKLIEWDTEGLGN